MQETAHANSSSTVVVFFWYVKVRSQQPVRAVCSGSFALKDKARTRFVPARVIYIRAPSEKQHAGKSPTTRNAERALFTEAPRDNRDICKCPKLPRFRGALILEANGAGKDLQPLPNPLLSYIYPDPSLNTLVWESVAYRHERMQSM